MRVGAAHQLALVLENLNMGNTGIFQQPASLIGPDANHRGDLRNAQFGQAEIVAGTEADHLATARLSLAAEKRARLAGKGGGLGQQGGEIVVKDESTLVGGIARRTRAGVART
jgi:hypothetical protein